MKKIERISGKTVYENLPYVSVCEDFVEFPAGVKGNYSVLGRFDFVTVVVLDADNFTYLVNQYRYPTQQESLEFPAGALDGDEDHLEAAKRELREETGVIASQFTLLGVANPLNSITGCRAYCYLAEGVTDLVAQDLDSQEDLEIQRCSIEKVDEMIKDGTIQDGPTIYAKHFLDLYLQSR